MAKSKGYQPSKRKSLRTATISFDADHEFYGAEIDVSLSASVALFLELAPFGEEGGVSGKDALSQFAEAIRRFAKKCLISWNVEDEEGYPVPATGDGLLDQDPAFVSALLGAWVQEVSSPSAPLVAPSADGSTSAAA